MKKKYIVMFLIFVLIFIIYTNLSNRNNQPKRENVDISDINLISDNKSNETINNITTQPFNDKIELTTLESSSKVIRKEFEELRKEYNNDDIIGYLKIDGTSIDYIVTQSKDNLFYLDNDIYKNKDLAGWIFLDYENDIFFEDRNTVIYGHNMKKDIMFHSIRKYLSEDFYKEHRYITFNTACEDNTWEIFSFYKADTEFRYIQVIFPTQEDFYNLVCEMKDRSIYDTGVEVMPDDRILTLSTCVGGDEEERYVINAKLCKKVKN